jgi:hypothetical protein
MPTTAPIQLTQYGMMAEKHWRELFRRCERIRTEGPLPGESSQPTDAEGCGKSSIKQKAAPGLCDSVRVNKHEGSIPFTRSTSISAATTNCDFLSTRSKNE